MEKESNGQANLDERAVLRAAAPQMIPRAMRVRVSDTEFTDELAEFLRARPDAIVQKIADNELEVSLVGSLDPSTMHMEIYLRVRAWESTAQDRGGRVEVIPPSGAG